MFQVTRLIIEGALKGLELTTETTVSFEVGHTYGGGWTGSRYIVTACEPIAA